MMLYVLVSYGTRGDSLDCSACDTNILLRAQNVGSNTILLSVTVSFLTHYICQLLHILFGLLLIDLHLEGKCKPYPFSCHHSVVFWCRGGGGGNITLNVSKNLQNSFLVPWQVNMCLTSAMYYWFK